MHAAPGWETLAQLVPERADSAICRPRSGVMLQQWRPQFEQFDVVSCPATHCFFLVAISCTGG